MAQSLLDRVRCSGLPPAGLVVAVSGGPDSVALTRALAAAREPGSPLVLAHLNHQLRGPESDAESLQFFTGLLSAITTTRTDIRTWADLLDLDDYVSFGGKA